MKKLFSKADLLYLTAPILTVLLCLLVQITKRQTLAIVNMFVTACGYETVTFIIKFYVPYRFRAFDLVNRGGQGAARLSGGYPRAGVGQHRAGGMRK